MYRSCPVFSEGKVREAFTRHLCDDYPQKDGPEMEDILADIHTSLVVQDPFDI